MNKQEYIKTLLERIESLENMINNNYIDLSTNLYKKDYFESTKESIALRMIKDVLNGKVWSIMFCDINKLKYINDSLGHEVADIGVKKIADIINFNTRKNQRENTIPDIIISLEEKDGLSFRVGGDEFLIFLPNCNKNDAVKIANRIKKCIEENKDETKGLTLAIGIVDTKDIDFKNGVNNLGIIEFKSIEFVSYLINLAEKNMYKDKILDAKNMPDDDKKEILKFEITKIANMLGLNIKNKEEFNKLLEEIKSVFN